MKRRTHLLLIALGCTALALTATGCGEKDSSQGAEVEEGPRVHGLTPAQAAQPVAKIGDTTITLGQFAEELASKGSFVRARYNSPERRRELLDQMIRFELLAQEAERRGYHELPEVERAKKQMMIRRLLEERFGKDGPESIPDEDVRAYYEANRSEFQTPQQVRASHIRIKDRRTALRVLAQVLADPNDLRLFRRLAEEHNTDPETRERFGDLRYFSRPEERTENEPEVPVPVAEAAFSIGRIGGIHPELVEVDGHYHIVKLTGRRAPMRRTLEEADRPIRNRLHRERREAALQELLERLRNEDDVEVSFEALDEVRLNLPEGDVPTLNPQHAPAPVLTPPTKAAR